MIDIKKYKKYWEEAAFKAGVEKENLRRKALDTADRLRDILAEEFHVKKVVLFGSVLEIRHFDEYSDIDIAVEGLPKDMYFAALGRLMMESPFDVDLKPVEDISGLLRQRIEGGKVIYEKRENSRPDFRNKRRD